VHAHHDVADGFTITQPGRGPKATTQPGIVALTGIAPEGDARRNIGTRPDPRDGGQVVRRDARQRVLGKRLGSTGLEDQQARRQDATGAQLLRDAFFDGAEVLADDEGAGPHGLEGKDVEQLGRRVAHVRPVARVGARRDPELAEQPHHVIDAQSATTGERGAHGLDERLVAQGAQLPRHERGQPPVLSGGGEAVGGRAHAAAPREDVLVRPCVGAASVEADGEIAHERKPIGASGQELSFDRPLAPRMEAQAERVGGGELVHRGRLGMAQRGGPLLVVGAVVLGQRAESRKPFERR
jgi:hypothetical protein